jgi:hypothetical protein
VVVTPGKYSVWFKTPIGEGSGLAELFADGRMLGFDSSFDSTGTWSLQDGKLHARISAKRMSAGPPGVFGLGVDEVDMTVTEYACDGDCVMCAVFARQAPGLRMEARMIRVSDDNRVDSGARAGS